MKKHAQDIFTVVLFVVLGAVILVLIRHVGLFDLPPSLK